MDIPLGRGRLKPGPKNITFLLLFAFLISKCPITSSHDSNHQCVMRSICGVDGELKQNCLYSGPPLPIGTVTRSQMDLCPSLFKGKLTNDLHSMKIPFSDNTSEV